MKLTKSFALQYTAAAPQSLAATARTRVAAPRQSPQLPQSPVAALLVAFIAAVALLWHPVLHAQALKKVTVALGGDGLQISTIHIANGAGFFKEEGIEIDLVDVNSGPRQVAAITGGSALFGPVGMIQAIKANSEGGNVAAVANLFSVLDIHVVISKEAMAKSGIVQSMPVDEKIRRLKGLRIGITSPGSTTDTTARTLFKARGMDPDQTVQLLPLGGGSNMLAALEKGATDGFVWSAPQPQIAVQKGIGEIIIDPFDRVVPEMVDVPYEVMMVNKSAAKQNEDLIRRCIRAMTKAMKFAHAKPDEALKIVQARFPNFDPAILQKAWPNYIKGVPDSPVITKTYYDNTLRWLNITAKSAVKTSYDEVVMNDVAMQAAKDILGK